MTISGIEKEFEADLVVEAYEDVADGVVALTLADPAGGPLPKWTPGAHIDLVLTDELTRQYSLCSSPNDPGRFMVGILLEPASRGGSKFVHEKLAAGSSVHVRGPRNHFALQPSAKYVFIAGGIGVTPIIPMIEQAEAEGAEWTLVYGGRSTSTMAFLDHLTEYGDRVKVIAGDDVALMAAALDEAIGTPRDHTLVYTCGPEGLLAAVQRRCEAWPTGSLHFERFTPKAVDGAVNEAFDVELSRSGVTLHVGAGQSIFEAAEAMGISVLGSCREGICGTCETIIVEGEADHRDSVLNEVEQDSNESMMICVSRCKPGSKLVLDM